MAAIPLVNLSEPLCYAGFCKLDAGTCFLAMPADAPHADGSVRTYSARRA